MADHMGLRSQRAGEVEPGPVKAITPSQVETGEPSAFYTQRRWGLEWTSLRREEKESVIIGMD